MRTVVTLSLLKSLNLEGFTVSFMKVLTGCLLCSLVFLGCDSSSSSSSDDREIGGNGGEGGPGSDNQGGNDTVVGLNVPMVYLSSKRQTGHLY